MLLPKLWSEPKQEKGAGNLPLTPFGHLKATRFLQPCHPSPGQAPEQPLGCRYKAGNSSASLMVTTLQCQPCSGNGASFPEQGGDGGAPRLYLMPMIRRTLLWLVPAASLSNTTLQEPNSTSYTHHKASGASWWS